MKILVLFLDSVTLLLPFFSAISCLFISTINFLFFPGLRIPKISFRPSLWRPFCNVLNISILFLSLLFLSLLNTLTWVVTLTSLRFFMLSHAHIWYIIRQLIVCFGLRGGPPNFCWFFWGVSPFWEKCLLDRLWRITTLVPYWWKKINW